MTKTLLILLVIAVAAGIFQGVVLHNWSAGVGTIIGATVIYGVIMLVHLMRRARE